MSKALPRSAFLNLENTFKRVVGPNAIHALSSFPVHQGATVITVGGDQLTGKTTLAKTLASYYGGKSISAGTVFREMAARERLSVGEFSKKVMEDHTGKIDVEIEYSLCKVIMCSDSKENYGIVVLEGRNPAVMSMYCMSTFKKRNIIRIYLSCSPRVQALRFIRREIGEKAYQHVKDRLPHKEYTSLTEVAQDVERLPIEGVKNMVDLFRKNAKRDDFDRERYMKIYEFPPMLDYRNKGLYDIVIDTTDATEQSTLEEALKKLASFGFSATEPSPQKDSKL